MPIIVGNTTTNSAITSTSLSEMAPQSFVVTNALRNSVRPALLLPFAQSGTVDPRITFTRASSGTYFNSQGVLTTAAANVPRIDFDPATGRCLGLLIEEGRTNSATNNTGAGAVISTTIASQSILSITFTTTTATVTTSANHGLAVNNIVTLNGVVSTDGSGTSCPYNGTFYVASVPTATSFTYTMLVSPTSGASVVGVYTAQTAGTLPTGWNISNPPFVTIVAGSGYENGIPYVDINIAGNTTGTNIYIGQSGQPSASVGQKWSGSSYLRLVSGSISNLSFFRQTFNEYNSSGMFLTQGLFDTSISNISNTTNLFANRPTATYTTTNASVNSITYFYTLIVPAGYYNFTLRIGAFQLELGAFPTSAILTSGSSASRIQELARIPLGSWYKASAFSLLVEAQKNTAADTGYGCPVELNDGGFSNRNGFYILPSTTTLFFEVAGYTNFIVGTYTLGTPYKAAGAVTGTSTTTGTIAGSLNGATTVTATITNLNSALYTNMNIGFIGGGANFMNGWIQRIAYYPVAFSNTQLQAMSS